MTTPQLIALSDSNLIIINDVEKLEFIKVNKNLNLLYNSQNNVVLAGHDGVYEFDSTFSNLSHLILPVTVEWFGF